MTCGAQEPVAWKPRQAPRQHSVQYMARKALLRAAPFSTLAQIAGAPALNSACLHCHNTNHLIDSVSNAYTVMHGCMLQAR